MPRDVAKGSRPKHRSTSSAFGCSEISAPPPQQNCLAEIENMATKEVGSSGRTGLVYRSLQNHFASDEGIALGSRPIMGSKTPCSSRP
jgi:hypothetical protein